MHDGPISRAYLGFLFENGFLFKKIYLLIYKRDLITKKEIFPNTPIFFKKKISKYIQKNQLNFWIYKLRILYPRIVREIEDKLSDSLLINKKIFSHLYYTKNLSKYSSHINEIFVDKISDIKSFLSQTSDETFLFSSGGILTKKCFENRNKIIHIHPGFLPFIKGADGLLWSLMLKNTAGVSAFYMNAKLDAGDIILRENIKLPKLSKNILDLDTKNIYRIIYSYIDPMVRVYCFQKLILQSEENINNLKSIKQNHSGTTYTFMTDEQKNKVFKKLC
tara:strand:- start:300 stop:1130 length:831 start_codon:yes stop_codon:yes gene_type:complete